MPWGSDMGLRVMGLWLLSVSVALAAEETTRTVEATGVAAILQGDLGKASDQALADAQRRAVEQAAGVFVSSETEVEKFELLRDTIRAKASGYLARYDVLERGKQDADTYAVKIKAVVKLNPIAADLMDVPAVMERLNRPRMMVVLEEIDRGQPSTQHLATAEAQKLLLEKGFDVVDATQVARLFQPEVLGKALRGEPAALLKVATEKGVETVIVGRIEVRALPDVAGLKSGAASVEAQAFETQTARLCAAGQVVTGDGDRPGAADVTADGAARKALAGGVRELLVGSERTGDRNAFIARLLTAWVTRATVLELRLAKVTFAQRKAVIAALKELRLVPEVTQRSFEDGVLTVELRGQAALDAMLDAVDGLKIGDRTVAVTGLKGAVATAELK